MRGHRRLRTFLKARRSGADLEGAADLAEMSAREAELHDEAEREGLYADIVVTLEIRGSNQGPADEALRGYVARIQRLTEEKKALQEDIKAIFQEAKSAGFNDKGIKNIIKLIELDPDKRAEHDEIMELYREAMGID
jgi:uncharacterized protein (UPF0335 family)